MRKRLRKKLHKRYLVDVGSDISKSPLWRQRLFASEFGQQFVISNATTQDTTGFLQFLQNILRRYRLSYKVTMVDLLPNLFSAAVLPVVK